MKNKNKNQLAPLAAPMKNENIVKGSTSGDAKGHATKEALQDEKKSNALRQRVNNAGLKTITLTLRADVLKEVDEMRQDKYLVAKTRRHIIMEAIQEKIMRYQALRASAKNRGADQQINKDKN